MNIQTYVVTDKDLTVLAGHGEELTAIQLTDTFYNRTAKDCFPIGHYKIIKRHWDLYDTFITLTINIKKIE